MNKLRNNKTRHGARRILLAILLAVFVLTSLSGMLGYFSHSVSAAEEEPQYSDVLEDLRQDPNFDESMYPTTLSGVDMQLVQILETADNELYAYFHFDNPFTTSLYSLYPTEIRLATARGENVAWRDYTLTSLSVSGAWGKYRVEGFSVLNPAERVYNIPCFFRPSYRTDAYEPDVDKQGYTAVKVAEEWTVMTKNGEKTYSMKEADAIVITKLYLGKYFAVNGTALKPVTTLMYYCAFDTDIQMDDVFEADVEYWHAYLNGSTYEKNGDKIEKTLKKGDVTGSIITNNLWTSNSTSTPETDEKYAAVQSKEDFSSNWSDSFNVDANARLQDKKWVLVLEHSTVKHDFGQKVGAPECVALDDFSILRLNYMKDGQVYNLGVVDNKRTSNPVNSAADNITAWQKFLSRVKSIMTNIFGWTNIADWQAILFLIVVALLIIVVIRIVVAIIK